MLTKQIVVLAALFASSAAFAADTISIDVSRPAGTLSRAEVAAEAERALAAGEIKNGPLADLYSLVEPAAPANQGLAKQNPVRKDNDTRVASAASRTK
jgi:hypothetical protein